MATLTMGKWAHASSAATGLKRNRIESIDLLRGTVMIIMALDHVRDFFHRDVFFYEPTELDHTNVFLFFTRWITHYCAPVFVFLAGISGYLYGTKKSKRELAFYLFTRGLWLIVAELIIISFVSTFNPAYRMFSLQIMWSTGFSMIALSAIVYMKRPFILLMAVLLIAGHNLLDTVHVPGNGFSAMFWCFLHEPRYFYFGNLTVSIQYPIIPWIGIITLGYYFGGLYNSMYDPEKRKKTLIYVGSAMIILFFILRIFNIYGDAALWSTQKNAAFTLLSFLKVTKYPPSLLYVLVTLGPAMIFLALTEKPLNKFTEKITVYGRVPFFYYVVHLFLIHLSALIAAAITGYNWSFMILTTKVYRAPDLKDYGFNLPIVYLVWASLVLLLYPCCKWFDNYKRKNQLNRPWLTYL